MKKFESIFTKPKLSYGREGCGVYRGFSHRFGKKPEDIVEPLICDEFVHDFLGIDYDDDLPQKIKIKMSTKKFDGAQQIYIDLSDMKWGTRRTETYRGFYTSAEWVLRYKLSEHINHFRFNIIPLWVGITRLNTKV